MIKFTVPCEEYLPSYNEAREEYEKNHVSTYRFTDASSCDIFVKFDNYRRELNLKPDRVGADFYWLVDDEGPTFIGEVTVRHKLNDALEKCGGHIGYGVRYSEWNRGYGTMMLSFALGKAKELGISTVQISCNDDNAASARVIEKNGFTLIDKPRVSKDGRTVTVRRYRKTLT